MTTLLLHLVAVTPLLLNPTMWPPSGITSQSGLQHTPGYTKTGANHYYGYYSYDETSKLRHELHLLKHPTPLLRALGLTLRWGVIYSLVTDYC